MPIRQVSIFGVGLLGGSFAMALRKHGFRGRIMGCDRAAVLERATVRGVIDEGRVHPFEATQGSQVIVLATPVLAIADLIAESNSSFATFADIDGVNPASITPTAISAPVPTAA